MQHSDVGFGILRNQSPPPAHQQASPITPVKFLSANHLCFQYIGMRIFFFRFT